jgi:hypothetical protein
MPADLQAEQSTHGTFKQLYLSLSGHLLIAKNGLFVARDNLKTAARTFSNYFDFFEDKGIR